MEKKERIIELAREGHSPKETFLILQEEFGQHAPCMSCIYKWYQKVKLGAESEQEQNKPGRKPDEELLTKIADLLEEEPFSSIGHMSRTFNIPKSTAHRYVTKYLGRVYKHTRWVPHLLSNANKILRMNACVELVHILSECKKINWLNIITGDQSWFTFGYGENGAWLRNEDEPPIMDGSKIQIKKIMVTVIWGVHGIYLIDVLPEGTSFDSTYFIEHIINPLSEMRPKIWKDSKRRKIWLHLDNCRVHNSKVSLEKTEAAGFKRAPHPPYSPDIAPSDFFLFGYTKFKLKGCKFEDKSDLIEKIYEILNKISLEKRKAVFEAWIERCNYILAHDGNYYHK